ncbi:MAG: NAD(P)H-binding protein [Gammaproteobacteria bacterium]|nr:NAD(P)H-binding protein [Gammaproteobacteria bacterium]
MIRLFSLCFYLLFLIACSNDNEPVVNESPPVPSTQGHKEIFLVSGVTGQQGGAVAKALLNEGYKVRGLSRNPKSDRALKMTSLGVEIVKGDFSDANSLDDALKGTEGVFLITNFWEHGYDAEVEQGKNMVDAAVRANISHLVFTSVANANSATGIPHFDSKYEIEEYIRSKNIDFTILRPVSFMDNWAYSREEIVAGKLTSPFSMATRLQQIAVRDIGRFAALAFQRPDEWKGRALDIAGEEYSVKQLVNIFSIMTGSPVEYIQIPWDEYEQSEGEEMTVMDRWIEGVGYSANINLVRSELSDMWTLEDYLNESGW